MWCPPGASATDFPAGNGSDEIFRIIICPGIDDPDGIEDPVDIAGAVVDGMVFPGSDDIDGAPPLETTVSWISVVFAVDVGTDAVSRVSSTELVRVRYTAPLETPDGDIRAQAPVTVTVLRFEGREVLVDGLEPAGVDVDFELEQADPPTRRAATATANAKGRVFMAFPLLKGLDSMDEDANVVGRGEAALSGDRPAPMEGLFERFATTHRVGTDGEVDLVLVTNDQSVADAYFEIRRKDADDLAGRDAIGGSRGNDEVVGHRIWSITQADHDPGGERSQEE